MVWNISYAPAIQPEPKCSVGERIKQTHKSCNSWYVGNEFPFLDTFSHCICFSYWCDTLCYYYKCHHPVHWGHTHATWMIIKAFFRLELCDRRYDETVWLVFVRRAQIKKKIMKWKNISDVQKDKLIITQRRWFIIYCLVVCHIISMTTEIQPTTKKCAIIFYSLRITKETWISAEQLKRLNSVRRTRISVAQSHNYMHFIRK